MFGWFLVQKTARGGVWFAKKPPKERAFVLHMITTPTRGVSGLFIVAANTQEGVFDGSILDWKLAQGSFVLLVSVIAQGGRLLRITTHTKRVHVVCLSQPTPKSLKGTFELGLKPV